MSRRLIIGDVLLAPVCISGMAKAQTERLSRLRSTRRSSCVDFSDRQPAGPPPVLPRQESRR